MDEEFRLYYYDKKGDCISISEFSQKLMDDDYKIIKKTMLPDGVWVSTVWMGINQDIFNQSEKPIIFETMVFKGESFFEYHMERYCTEEEALVGHENVCEMVRNGEIEIKWRNICNG